MLLLVLILKLIIQRNLWVYLCAFLVCGQLLIYKSLCKILKDELQKIIDIRGSYGRSTKLIILLGNESEWPTRYF